MSLNPRFDGAFLNSKIGNYAKIGECLNPRFDGAFLNFEKESIKDFTNSLNPRFDGAFLNSICFWMKEPFGTS